MRVNTPAASILLETWILRVVPLKTSNVYVPARGTLPTTVSEPVTRLTFHLPANLALVSVACGDADRHGDVLRGAVAGAVRDRDVHREGARGRVGVRDAHAGARAAVAERPGSACRPSTRSRVAVTARLTGSPASSVPETAGAEIVGGAAS